MRKWAAVPSLLLVWQISGCAPSLSFPPTAQIRFETEVDYVEVGGLIAATENVMVPLGPGRSYWFNGLDGSRWASDLPTVPPQASVVILREGHGVVYTPNSTQVIRQVGGRVVVRRGWYGRVVETRAGPDGAAEVMIEDGRRFEVAAEGDELPERLPYEVLLSEDSATIFVLRSGEELEVVRELPRG